jgi:hypothetical protein
MMSAERIPTHFGMTLGELAQIIGERFVSAGKDRCIFQLGVGAKEDGEPERKLAITFAVTVEEVNDFTGLLPSTPRH